jgi:hypothetical protein
VIDADPLRLTPHASRALLLLAVAATYAGALRADFQFDDYNVIVGNPVVHAWAAWWADAAHGIRPLLKASYTLCWTMGPGAFGFHLVNVLVHAANTLLIYALSTRLLSAISFQPSAFPHAARLDSLRVTRDALRGKQSGVSPDASSPFPGFRLTPHASRFLSPHSSPLTGHIPLVTALLFAVHPIQTEAVTYISGRSVSLMALCYLGSVLAYVHAQCAGGVGRRRLLHGLSLGLFVAALLVKETAVTLPAALLLWEVTVGDRGPWRVIVKRLAPHWMLLGVAAAWLWWHPGYHSLFAYSFSLRSLHDAVLTQIHGIVYLLSRLLLVHRLNIDPDLPVITAWTPGLVAESLALGGCLGAALWAFRRQPWMAFGILWVFLHLLPTNSVVPRLDVANERQVYLAGWGVFLLAGAGLARLSLLLPRPAMATAVTGLAVVWLGAATVARNGDYRTEVSLWNATVLESPAKARGHNNLGYAYALAGRPKEAEQAYRTALRLDPDFVIARRNLAMLHQH